MTSAASSGSNGLLATGAHVIAANHSLRPVVSDAARAGSVPEMALMWEIVKRDRRGAEKKERAAGAARSFGLGGRPPPKGRAVARGD